MIRHVTFGYFISWWALVTVACTVACCKNAVFYYCYCFHGHRLVLNILYYKNASACYASASVILNILLVHGYSQSYQSGAMQWCDRHQFLRQVPRSRTCWLGLWLDDLKTVSRSRSVPRATPLQTFIEIRLYLFKRHNSQRNSGFCWLQQLLITSRKLA